MATVEQVLNEMESIADDYRSERGGLDLYALAQGVAYVLDLDTGTTVTYKLMALAQAVEARMVTFGGLESKDDFEARELAEQRAAAAVTDRQGFAGVVRSH